MNKYLRYLKAETAQPNDPANLEILQMRLSNDPPKPPKPKEVGFGGFGGCQGERFQKHEALDCNDAYRVSAARDLDGELYLSWGPLLLHDTRRMRGEIVEWIDRLAAAERWPRELRNDVLTRAIRGPLSDLLPNWHHFCRRIGALERERAEWTDAQRRSWHFHSVDGGSK